MGDDPGEAVPVCGSSVLPVRRVWITGSPYPIYC